MNCFVCHKEINDEEPYEYVPQNDSGIVQVAHIPCAERYTATGDVDTIPFEEAARAPAGDLPPSE